MFFSNQVSSDTASISWLLQSYLLESEEWLKKGFCFVNQKNVELARVTATSNFDIRFFTL